MREPSWLVWMVMKAMRLLLLTILWTGVGMGVGLFCGIIGVAGWSAVGHHTPEMDMAYRRVAVPVAVIVGGCAFLWNLLRIMQAAVRRRQALVDRRR